MKYIKLYEDIDSIITKLDISNKELENPSIILKPTIRIHPKIKKEFSHLFDMKGLSI